MAKYVDMIPWEECPHLMPPILPAEELAEFEAGLAPHQREARKKGIPAIGSGAIYPVTDESILCEPRPIPPHWGQSFGFDVGWNMTAAVFLAHDPDRDVVYVTGEYYETAKEPVIHAHSLRAMMGYPLKGAIDPAADHRNQKDGKRLLTEYKSLGLDLKKADNAVEAGIHACLVRMQTGRLKVFNTCVNLIKEKRLYRRDEKGKVVKERDHLMDAMRYGVFTKGCFRQAPEADEGEDSERYGEF